LVLYLGILLVSTVGVSLWVGQLIEAGIVSRTGAVTALYVDSVIGPHLQSMQGHTQPSGADTASINAVLGQTDLGRSVVSFKVWAPDGTVAWASNADLVGRKFAVDADLAASLAGEVTADVSGLDAEENVLERQRWSRLLQVYVPVRADGTGTIIAAAEFYLLPDAVDAQVAEARTSAWLVILVAAAVGFLAVAVVARRWGRTIGRQDAQLRGQVVTLTALVDEVQQLHERLGDAARRTVEAGIEERRRISSDLHDGPIQGMALGLLRLDALQSRGHDDPRTADDRNVEVAAVRDVVADALGDARGIASGLQLPRLEGLTLSETLTAAVEEHRRRSGRAVALDDELEGDAPLVVKIAVFRTLQEALSNATRHGRGEAMAVRGWVDDGRVHVEVSDRGPGFEATVPGRGLGLDGMRDRAALLGGSVAVESEIGRGTVVRLALPLDPASPHHEVAAAEPPDNGGWSSGVAPLGWGSEAPPFTADPA
jgi:hypothetical protein